MTDPAIILAGLRARGIRFWLDQGKPKLEPASLMTPADWQALKDHREVLLAILEVEAEEFHPALRDGRRCWVRGGLSPDDEAAAMRTLDWRP